MTGRIGILVQRHPGKILAVSLCFGVILSLFAPGVRIEDNLMEMEAKGLESIELQDLLVEEFGMAPDGLFILSSDIQELEGLEEELSELQTVASVDSIHSYLPSEERQLLRRGLITEYAERISQRPPSDPAIDRQGLLDEVFRLEMNLMELGDMAYLGKMERISPVLNRITGIDDEGSKYRRTVFDDLAASLLSDAASPQLQLLQSQVDRSMAYLLTDMADPQLITREMLPDMFRDSFVSRDGSRYIMTINAKENPWVGEHREAFTTQVGSVTGRATGMILVADQLTYMAANDGIRSALLALLIVGLILVADFRNIRLALLTFLPLLLSFGTLFGIMAITGIRFDFINVIAIPLLIGIGIDDAVHIDHRYRKEGPGSMDRVIARTGTAVLLTTITTIIGFASFIPSVMRAMRSTGIVLSLAMALAFFYSIFLHPAVLILVHERLGASFASWGDKEEES